jgi:NADPH-dependent 2,4-dienoyl-CoA reductase/sulfur reductase-like enzyme
MPLIDSTALAAQLPWDVVVAGAGAAGAAAALAARQRAAAVLLLDLAAGPGGALAAMGLGHGDDTALAQAGVRRSYQTTLLGIRAGLELRMLSPRGISRVMARALVLATGGREQTRGNLALPGTRPAGVLTAGAALRLLAATSRLPGRRAVVAGLGRWVEVAAQALERAGTMIVAIVPAVAQIDGWPRITSATLEDRRRLDCDLLVLATALAPWLPAALADAGALPGVFMAGSAAQGEIDAREAAEAGADAGRRAAEWALHDK